MIQSVFLDYDLSVFLNADYSTHQGSCVKHQVHELTDIHKEFGGFPDSYSYENTKIHQLWWTKDQVDFAEIGKQMNIDVVTISSILQPPGCVIPVHRDTFYQINQQFKNDTRTKVRANLCLEEWKVGHLLQYRIGEEWNTYTHWKAGEGLVWDSSILHLGANVGMNNKFTLQVSGFYND
jgi:hypothetical protein